MQKAVFFDRDGVVNVNNEYVYKISDFVYMSGFVEFFRVIKKRGFLAFVVTNQSGINRGFYSERDFENLSDFMQNDLRQRCGFCFDKIYHCPHLPSENCLCRKPKIGMIENAMRDFDIDLGASYLIGDNESDIECAINAGIKTQILLNKNAKQSKAGHIVSDFQQIFSIIAPL
ncbi:D-glycero-alpha-D-manno-heptose-1,7-bisphosphate 7-phosphatase [Helicobacter sp. 23-1044]